MGLDPCGSVGITYLVQFINHNGVCGVQVFDYNRKPCRETCEGIIARFPLEKLFDSEVSLIGTQSEVVTRPER